MGETARPFPVPEGYRFIGRTFGEYSRMFALNPEELGGRTVLDCPGGPGAFSAVASAVGATVLAIDPMYGPDVSALEPICADAVDRTAAQLGEQRDLFVWSEYGDVETRVRFLRSAAERFLADYARHPGRYLPAALPTLPFAADTFDLVLSGNFLFLYDDRLDLAFHRRAIRELVRVAVDEVRVFPLASLDRTRSEYVSPVVEDLRDSGLSVECRGVPYEFQPGATDMLVVSPS